MDEEDTFSDYHSEPDLSENSDEDDLDKYLAKDHVNYPIFITKLYSFFNDCKKKKIYCNYRNIHCNNCGHKELISEYEDGEIDRGYNGYLFCTAEDRYYINAELLDGDTILEVDFEWGSFCDECLECARDIKETIVDCALENDLQIESSDELSDQYITIIFNLDDLR
jgi:hypothetical protein